MANKKWQTPFIIFVAVVVVVGGLIFMDSNGDDGSFSSGLAQKSTPGAVREMAFDEDMSYGESFMVNDSVATLNAAEEEAGANDVQDRLIIRTANISMVVSNVREAIDAISKYAAESEGFVVSSDVNKFDLGLSGSVTIRIPSDTFDKGVGDFKEMGEVTSESIYGQDVTEEYVDLDAQLSNLRATEQAFVEILDRSGTIEEVLAVQKEIQNVRSRIERLEGRMKYLSESARLSTITVYLSTDPGNLPIVDEGDEWKPVTVFKDAFRSLVGLGKGILNFLIWLLVYTPVWILGGFIIWILVKLGKKIFK